MEEEPKSVWRRPWKGRQALVYWLLIVPLAAFLAACLLSMAASANTPLFARHPGFVGYFECVLIITFSLIMAIAVVFGVGNFILWAFKWRNFKRVLFGCACLATLIALFYAEEDWRGRHEWKKFEQQWEAKGENFDRASVVPAPVPDDQNFAMSAVWIAGIKDTFLEDPKRAEAWYGDRIYSEEVSNYLRMLPMTVSGLIGTNWWYWNLPGTPDISGNWAIARITDLRPWQSYYRDVEQTHPLAKIPVTARPQTPAQDVLLALSKFDPLIERLRQDSRLPDSRFPIEYNEKDRDQDPAAILLPHLANIKQYAKVLELRAIAELQNGQSDKALADIHLMFRLVDANRTEPFIISHLIRADIAQMALQPIYEGLARHQWSDAQLSELETGLSKFDFLDAYRFTMHGEAIFGETGIMDYLRHHPEEIANLSFDDESEPPIDNRFVARLIPAGWFYQNELRGVRAAEEDYLPAVDTRQGILSPSSIRRAKATVEAETSDVDPYNVVERMRAPYVLKPAITFAYAQNSVNLARIAIALERYHMVHGDYPDSLDALAQQFTGPIPHDIINGEPLHYWLTADGRFVLYSVGWNERDDGGVVVWKGGSTRRSDGETPDVDREQGDWVWRYPDK